MLRNRAHPPGSARARVGARAFPPDSSTRRPTQSTDELKFSIVTLTQGIRKFNTALTVQVDEWNDEDGEGKPAAS